MNLANGPFFPAVGGFGAFRLAPEMPVITPGRVLLRAPRVADFDIFAELVGSPRGACLGGPLCHESAWRLFARLTAGDAPHAKTFLGIGHAGQLAGFLALEHLPDHAAPLLRIVLRQQVEGQGIAEAAARHACGLQHGTPGNSGLLACIDPDNARARALALRLGGNLIGRRDGNEIWSLVTEGAL